MYDFFTFYTISYGYVCKLPKKSTVPHFVMVTFCNVDEHSSCQSWTEKIFCMHAYSNADRI